MKSRVLTVEGVSLRRGGKNLLQDVSFQLDSMEVLSVIGAKGSGKGLLVKTVLGIQRGTLTGHIKAVGQVGLVSRDYPCIDDFSVFENLSIIAKYAGVRSQTHLGEEIEETLRAVDLWTELKNRLHGRVGELSDFQKIRLELARTLLFKPTILILDKPTLNVDPEKKSHYEAIIERLKSQMSIIWVNHDLEQAARVSDKVVYLKNGRMVEFGTCEVMFTMPVSPDTENFISRRAHA